MAGVIQTLAYDIRCVDSHQVSKRVWLLSCIPYSLIHVHVAGFKVLVIDWKFHALNEFRQCLESLYVQDVAGLVVCRPWAWAGCEVVCCSWAGCEVVCRPWAGCEVVCHPWAGCEVVCRPWARREVVCRPWAGREVVPVQVLLRCHAHVQQSRRLPRMGGACEGCQSHATGLTHPVFTKLS